MRYFIPTELTTRKQLKEAIKDVQKLEDKSRKRIKEKKYGNTFCKMEKS